MRPVLSTRLFSSGPPRAAEVDLARGAGFVDVEIHAGPRHLDVLDPGAVRRVARELRRAGLHAAWLHLEQPALNRLRERGALERLGDAIRMLEAGAVAASLRAWGVREDAAFLDLDALRTQIEMSGARLALDLPQVDERVLRRLPGSVGICWDLAGAEDATGADVLSAGGRLLAVRVARPVDGRRGLPDRREAQLLEEVFRRHAPGDLIYDVDDPSGFGALVELEHVLDDLRAFHAGSKRPHPEQGGGLFWASLAPA